MLNNNFSNIEAEQIILGTIIINNMYLIRVEDIIEPKHFYIDFHKKLYDQILTSIKQNKSIANQITLKELFENEAKELEGVKYLSKLLSVASTIADIREYAFVVVDAFNKRLQQELYQQALLNLQSNEANIVAQEVINKLNSVELETKEIIIKTGDDVVECLKSSWKQDINSICVPSGIASLDKMINGGFYPQKLYIIGAEPGCGKTSLAQQIILKALEKRIGCFFFSMEMEAENVICRFLGNIGSLNPFKILSKNLNQSETIALNKALESWAELKDNFIMSDTGNISVAQIRATIKRHKRKKNIGLIVVDYAQLLRLRDVKNLNEATLIKENITALKEIAKEFNVCVICLSQITKDSVGGRPGLKSLKGSGGIAEGADSVINIWSEKEDKQEANKIKSLNLELAKNRNGISGTISIHFHGEFGRFTERFE